jgi:hypothetical protein
MNATDKHHLPVSDATTDAMTHTADVAPVVPHQQAVDHLSATAKFVAAVRSGCMASAGVERNANAFRWHPQNPRSRSPRHRKQYVPITMSSHTSFSSAIVRAPDASVPQSLRKGPRGPVPYIAMWSAEKLPVAQVLQTRSGIHYADESLLDRDADGVLWTRADSRRGEGEPYYKKVHPLRQRKAMRRLLCQVCAGRADHTEQGSLWVLPDCQGDWPNWPEGMHYTQPPLCVRCARISVKACPWLKPGFVAVRAQSRVIGVTGVVYRAGIILPEPTDDDDTVPYADPAIRWVQATQLVRELYGCTVVELS